MAFRAYFVQRHAAKHFFSLAVMALLVPIAAQGASFSPSTQTPSSTCLPGLYVVAHHGRASQRLIEDRRYFRIWNVDDERYELQRLQWSLIYRNLW